MKRLLLFLFIAVLTVTAQQPQTQSAPLFSANAKYTNGVAPGYAPTYAATGLTLNIGKGTSNCLGVLVEYAGGTLAMTNSTTNYVFLNAGSSCVPASNTSAFLSTDIWLYKVVTSGGNITSVDDVRTGFLAPGTGAGTVAGTGTSPHLTRWYGASTIGNATPHDAFADWLCPDTSGSGTAQSCSTPLTFSPASGDCVVYKTTTTNTGDVTLNVNSSSAVHIRKWLGAAVLVSGDLVANTPQVICYDGTYWEVPTIGNIPAFVTSVTHGIPFTIGDPAGSTLTVATTTTDYFTVPAACTISAYNLVIDAGTITVKFWKIATGTAIPTSSNSISTSGVSISSGTANHSTTLSDFTTTTVTANDIMAMNVTAVTTAKYVQGVLQCDGSH